MNPLGIVQVVDSLDAGGAERMAVNISNHLARNHYRSYLCTTRRGGPLEEFVAPAVTRLRLRRRVTADPAAIVRFARFLRAERIQVVHAHATSLFFAHVAAALARVPVIWHDHYGRCEFDDRPVWSYRAATRGIGGIIAVNRKLADWARKSLRVSGDRVWYLPNFVETTSPEALPRVPGKLGLRIVCVANFRPQKDHPSLLNAMALVKASVPDAHLLLIGEAADDSYKACLLARIAELGLERSVTWLGARRDVPAILEQCDVGVLSSRSEGLPLALLEYGAAGLATVATAVGETPEVLGTGSSGVLAPPGCPEALASAMIRLLQCPQQRREIGEEFRARVNAMYGAERIGRQLFGIYETVLRASGPRLRMNHA